MHITKIEKEQLNKQADSSSELQQLEYEDTLVQLNSCCQQYGCRAVLIDFRDMAPKMFEELMVQGNRLIPKQQLARLLQPPVNNAGTV